jgi:hypothetical protein
MTSSLPERRLVVRAGPTLVALDLTQIREVGGTVTQTVVLLSLVLGLTPTGPGVAVLTMEHARGSCAVAVDGVGGVVEVPRKDVLPLGAQVLLRRPGLVRAMLRVLEPTVWRGTSLLPAPAGGLEVLPSSGKPVLAVDLDPVELGALLEVAARQATTGTTP